MAHDFTQLHFWMRSKNFYSEIYQQTNIFPKEELFGLTSQMRRCSVSIASNIAEGSSRSSQKDFARFLEISIGSAYELETQLLIARDIGYLDDVKTQHLLKELKEIILMTSSFKGKLKIHSS